MALPSGFTTSVAGIDSPVGEVDEAFPPMSVVLRLADEIDVSRGDLLVRPNESCRRTPGPRSQGLLMDETTALTAGRTLAIKHTTLWARAKVREVV